MPYLNTKRTGEAQAQKITDTINQLLPSAHLANYAFNPVAAGLSTQSYVPAMTKHVASLLNMPAGTIANTPAQNLGQALADYQIQKSRAAEIPDQRNLWSKLTGAGENVLGTGLRWGAMGLDVLNRTNAASQASLLAAAKSAKTHDLGGFLKDVEPLKEYWKGLKGDTHVTGQDVISELGMQGKDVKSRITRGLLGLGLEIGTDPLSLLGTGKVASMGPEKLAQNLAKSGLESTVKAATKKKFEELSVDLAKGPSKGRMALSKGDKGAIATAALDAQEQAAKASAQYAGVKHSAWVFNRLAGQGPKEAALNAAKAADRQVVDPLMKQAAEEMDRVLAQSTSKRLALRVAGRDMLAGQKLSGLSEKAYAPFQKSAEWMGEHFAPYKTIRTAFKYEAHFPGQMAYLRRKVMSEGLHWNDDVRNEVSRILKGVSLSDRKEMTHAIENGTAMSGVIARGSRAGVRLEDVRQQVQALIRFMGDEKVKAGLLDPNALADNTYVPHIWRSSKQYRDKALVKDWKDLRHKVLEQTGHTTPDITVAAAQQNGLKVEDDIAKILTGESAKSHNKLTSHWLQQETLGTYGRIMSKSLVKDAKDLAQISEVPLSDLKSKNWGKLLKKDQAYYLPKEYHEAMKKFNGFVNNPEEVRTFYRYLDNASRWFKFANTIPNPAYHVNNLMGDMMMTYWDGIGPREFGQELKRMMARTPAGKLAGLSSDVPLAKGVYLKWDEAKKLYETHALGSNYAHSELPIGVSASFSRPGDVTQKALQGLRRGSEMREDAGRMLHFNAALGQEYRHISKGKVLTGAEHRAALEKAARNASIRVNKYNIDYAALTPFEQNVMKRLVPFYTYARKATPLLWDVAYKNPGRFVKTTKGIHAIESMAGAEHDPTEPLVMPGWMLGMNAYAKLSNANDFNYLDFSGLPSNLFSSQIAQPGATEQEFERKQFARLNPGIRLPLEHAFGKQLFNNADTGNLGEMLWNTEVPGIRTGKRVANAKDAMDWLSLFGVPVGKRTTQQQVGAVKGKTAPFKATVADENKRMRDKGYEIVTRNLKSGKVYSLKDTATDQILGTYSTPAAAQKAYNNMKG